MLVGRDQPGQPEVIRRDKDRMTETKIRNTKCDNGSRGWSDMGPSVKGCGQPLETGKSKETDSRLEPPERNADTSILAP